MTLTIVIDQDKACVKCGAKGATQGGALQGRDERGDKMTETVSNCCRAPIKSYIPNRNYIYRTSPVDPIPYCSECGAEDPEEVEAEQEKET